MYLFFMEKVGQDKEKSVQIFLHAPVLYPIYESEIGVVFLPLAYCGQYAK